MRWFKHFTDLRRDPAIRKVERKLGEAGYARAVKVSELIAQHGGSGAQFVPRIDLNDPATDMDWLADELGLKSAKEAERTVAILSDAGWLDKKLSRKRIVSRPAMLQERDVYSERQQRKNPLPPASQHTSDKVGSATEHTSDKVGSATEHTSDKVGSATEHTSYKVGSAAAQKQKQRERSASQSPKSSQLRPASKGAAEKTGRKINTGKIIRQLSETIGGSNGTGKKSRKHFFNGITGNRCLNAMDDSHQGNLSLKAAAKEMLAVTLTDLFLNRGLELKGIEEKSVHDIAWPVIKKGVPVVEAVQSYAVRKILLTDHVINCAVNAAVKLVEERDAHQ